MLKNKKILLGVTGSIAAYKSAHLTRILIKAGAEVRIVMTPSAGDFITPLTLSTLSKNAVLNQYWNKTTGEWTNHVDLALWADIILIAPASANTLAKMAGGICDNLLMATYLSAKSPVLIAPAMDLDMYKHPAVLNNLEKLRSFGHQIIPAENGELASGLLGEGRMAEPENIVSFIESFLKIGNRFEGKKVMVSAGPTYEQIDPVRYIGNNSSGKMGIAIANELKSQGAEVTLVLGPISDNLEIFDMNIVKVISAEEMYIACTQHAKGKDVVIMSAAVADYTPSKKELGKIKKEENSLILELSKTKDILKKLGELKPKNQILVGFALETDNEYDHAVEKLKKKNLDFIVLNSLKDVGAGFKSDTNKITIIDKKLNSTEFTLKTKKEVAKDIINKIIEISS